VRDTVRPFLRLEGGAAFLAGAALWSIWGGDWLWLLPALLAPDISALGYIRGPVVGAWTYNLAHNWALALALIGVGWWSGTPWLVLIGTALAMHVGIDRLLGYGLKLPTGFQETHLGRIGRRREGAEG
jgi:Domain of unknown function (DUF4260)